MLWSLFLLSWTFCSHLSDRPCHSYATLSHASPPFHKRTTELIFTPYQLDGFMYLPPFAPRPSSSSILVRLETSETALESMGTLLKGGDKLKLSPDHVHFMVEHLFKNESIHCSCSICCLEIKPKNFSHAWEKVFRLIRRGKLLL